MTVLPAAWWRLLTPLVWGVVVVAVGMVLALFADPFGWRARRLDRAEQAAAVGQAEARMRRAEHTAQHAIVQGQRDLQEQQLAVTAITEKSVEQARAQSDAKTPLGDDRHQRLREHDRRLCEQAPSLRGCAAFAGAAP